MNDYFEKKGNMGVYVIVGAALCFAAGYEVATYRAKNADIQVKTLDNNETILSYRNSPYRILTYDNGVATLGTLSERIEDLLNEEPQKIRRLTQDSLRK